jgi:hypothetical protein
MSSSAATSTTCADREPPTDSESRAPLRATREAPSNSTVPVNFAADENTASPLNVASPWCVDPPWNTLSPKATLRPAAATSGEVTVTLQCVDRVMPWGPTASRLDPSSIATASLSAPSLTL